jgi:hypothetical protein
MISRRAILVGGGLFGVIGGAGVLGIRMLTNGARRSAAATADYLAGRVVVVAGWIVSETEAEDIPAEARRREPTASVSDSASGGE